MLADGPSVSVPRLDVSETCARLGLSMIWPWLCAAQACALRVQRAQQVQVALGRQADDAGLEAAGVDAAGHGQAAAVHRDADLARAHLVAHDQIALLDLETARAMNLARVQAGVQSGEVGQRPRPQRDLGVIEARACRPRRTGRTRRPGWNRAGRSGRRRRQRRRGQRAAALLARRQVDDRAAGTPGRYCPPRYPASGRRPRCSAPGREQHFAASQVQARLRAQAQVALGLDLPACPRPARSRRPGPPNRPPASTARRARRLAGQRRRALRPAQRQAAARRGQAAWTRWPRPSAAACDVQVAAAVGACPPAWYAPWR